MKSLQLLLITLLSGTQICYGQSQPQASAGFDIGVGFDKNSFAPSVLYHEELSVHQIPWLRFGVGLRGWGLYSGKTDLYSQKSSVPTDTLKFRNVSANGISFVIGINIRVWKIDLGANTDLAGFAFGSKRNGFYSSNTSAEGGGAYYNKWISTSPVLFNMIPLALAKYNGQSEVFARIWLTRKLGLKFGYLYGQAAYQTRNVNDKRIYLDNRQRRFSDTYGIPYAAVTFPLLY